MSDIPLSVHHLISDGGGLATRTTDILDSYLTLVTLPNYMQPAPRSASCECIYGSVFFSLCFSRSGVGSQPRPKADVCLRAFCHVTLQFAVRHPNVEMEYLNPRRSDFGWYGLYTHDNGIVEIGKECQEKRNEKPAITSVHTVAFVLFFNCIISSRRYARTTFTS